MLDIADAHKAQLLWRHALQHNGHVGPTSIVERFAKGDLTALLALLWQAQAVGLSPIDRHLGAVDLRRSRVANSQSDATAVGVGLNVGEADGEYPKVAAHC